MTLTKVSILKELFRLKEFVLYAEGELDRKDLVKRIERIMREM